MTTYARALFPGIAQIQSFTASIGHGTQPTAFRVTIAPQPSNVVIEIGTLRLEYNDQFLEFPDCRVDEAAFRMDASGRLIEVTILDRRWRWSMGTLIDADNFGRISGEYNARREDGTIVKIDGGNPAFAVEDTERTPEQLARLCLEAAAEDIAADALAALPADVRPSVNWDAANPMQELNALAEEMNCRLVLCLDNKVRIFKVNQGRELPAGGVMAYGDSADYFDAPDQVSVLTGWVRYQHDFELEDVAQDVDGNWKRTDDVSYKPAGGWEHSDVLSELGLLDEQVTQNIAIQTVWRCYRIKVPFELPGFGTITRREQLILLSSQIFQQNDDGIKRDRPAMVYGVWYRGDDAAPQNSATSDQPTYLPDDLVEKRKSDDARVAQIVRIPFSIDVERGIVWFADRIWKESLSGGRWEAASLRLRTTCYAKRLTDGRIQRYEFPRVLRQSDRPCVKDLIHEEIKPHVWATYGNGFAVAELKTNEDKTIAEINHYLNDAQAIYSAAKVPQIATYSGLVFDCDLDGAIQRITYRFATNYASTTTIERNQDAGLEATPYRLSTQHAKLARMRRDVARREWTDKRQDELSRARAHNQ